MLKLGQDAVAAVDDLVEMVAAYGYDYRAEAEAGVAAARLTMIIASAMGLVIGLMLAIGFPFAAARTTTRSVRPRSVPVASVRPPEVSRTLAGAPVRLCDSRMTARREPLARVTVPVSGDSCDPEPPAAGSGGTLQLFGAGLPANRALR